MLNRSLPNVRVLTHSSIRLCGDTGSNTTAQAAPVIYFDPFNMAEEPHDADFVFITHAHYDHFSPEDLEKVLSARTELVAPASMKNEIERFAAQHQVSTVHLMQAGETAELSALSVEAVPAYNVMPERLGNHPQRNGWLGYVVTLDGVRYYVAGDTDQTPENEQVSCDVALIPIGGTYTMDPVQAAAFANTIKPQVVVPTHYGSIVGTMADADTFAAAVDPAITVTRKVER